MSLHAPDNWRTVFLLQQRESFCHALPQVLTASGSVPTSLPVLPVAVPGCWLVRVPSNTVSARMFQQQLLGCAFLGCTAVTWVAASFLSQHLVSGQQPSLHPFLLCWICTSMFSLYLPIIHCRRWLSRPIHRSLDADSLGQSLLSAQAHGAASIGPVLFPDSSRLAVAAKVLPVAVIFVIAQTLFSMSLANTSVTSNTILSSSSSMWTLLASALVLKERVTVVKLLSVVAVMAGTAMVTFADSNEGSAGGSDRSLYGDSLCVASAVCYSTYTVMMQQQLQEDNPDIPALFFGYVGVLTATLGAPVVFLLHWLGVYNLLKLDPIALGLALLNGLLDYVVADYTWARAVLLLGPTVATLGTSVQVPLATSVDLVLGHPHWVDSWQAVGLTTAGTALILGGVGGINLDPHMLKHCSRHGPDDPNPDSEADASIDALLRSA